MSDPENSNKLCNYALVQEYVVKDYRQVCYKGFRWFYWKVSDSLHTRPKRSTIVLWLRTIHECKEMANIRLSSKPILRSFGSLLIVKLVDCCENRLLNPRMGRYLIVLRCSFVWLEFF